MIHGFKADSELHWKAMLRGHRVHKPIIAAVEGFALAGGTELLQTTDIRVAGRCAQFGLTEATLGLFPLGGSTVRLPRQVSYTKAMEILLLGQRFTAQEALEMGLIGRVVDTGEALEEATRLARIIADNGPLAVQAIKRSVVECASMSEADGLAHELKLGWPVFQSQDAREGPRAFAEKRKPVFKGK
jgi:enoyl-CoA hydratase